MSAPRRSRTAAAFVLAVVFTLASVFTAQTAHAADGVVSGGRLDWGIKKSFQNYVTGPIAKGSWTLVDGAGTTGDSQFRFHSASGTYDDGSGDFTAAYSGGVRFQGHQGDDGQYEMDLTIVNPTVRLSGGGGMVHVDIIARHGGGENVRSQVPFGTLSLGGLDTSGAGSSLALFDVPVTLTAEGAESFEGYYAEGTELDPMNFSGDIVADSPDDSDDKDKDKDKPSKKGEFVGAAVDWGVKRTWREFVEGDIAQGGWELSDGAQDGGAIFRFPDGEGRFDEKKETLKATFAGTLSFTGTDIDVALSDVAVEIADGEGTLSATVTEAGESETDVPIITFDAPELTEEDGLVLLSETPAQLTEGGAEALAGLYQPGTEMDPVTVAVPLTDDAEIPPLPDLGSEPEPTPAEDETTAAAEETGGATGWIVLAAALVLVAAALVVFWRLRARRAGDSAASGDDPTETPNETTDQEGRSSESAPATSDADEAEPGKEPSSS